MTEYKSRKRPVLKSDEENKPNEIKLIQPKVDFNIKTEYKKTERPKTEETISDLLLLSTEEQNKTATLSNLLNDLKDVVDETLSEEVWIVAEIAKLKQQGKNGHIYLELIDRDLYGNELSKINAKIWSSNAYKITNKFELATKEKIKDGIKCEWLVRLDYNIKYGLSLTISDIKPLWTIGEHEKKKEEIRKKLKEENLWWKQQNILSPNIITSIAVIAPQEAAGLGDFISEANKWKEKELIKVDVFNATFEGEKTSSSIQDALLKIKKQEDIYFENNKTSLYDIIIILRGGGAKTSLAWLDDYGILHQVLSQNTPVWSAIGHEQDNGLLDEISSLSLHTPSKAAQRIWDSLQKEYYNFEQGFSFIANEKSKRCDKLENNIKNITENIIYEAYQRIDSLKRRTTELSREAITLGPQATLERGYVIIKDSENHIIKSADELENKETITIQWHDSNKKINLKESKK